MSVPSGILELRQKLSKYYRINGAVYVRTIKYNADDCVELLSESECAYIMEKEKSVDIDYEYDFIIAEAMMNYK